MQVWGWSEFRRWEASRGWRICVEARVLGAWKPLEAGWTQAVSLSAVHPPPHSIKSLGGLSEKAHFWASFPPGVSLRLGPRNQHLKTACLLCPGAQFAHGWDLASPKGFRLGGEGAGVGLTVIPIWALCLRGGRRGWWPGAQEPLGWQWGGWRSGWTWTKKSEEGPSYSSGWKEAREQRERGLGEGTGYPDLCEGCLSELFRVSQAW